MVYPLDLRELKIVERTLHVCVRDAVEAHSCINADSKMHLMSNTQLLIVERQDV